MMVSQGGFGATTSAVGVREIYEALFGVTGNKVDLTKAIFPNGVPTKIPAVNMKLAASAKLDTTGIKINGTKVVK